MMKNIVFALSLLVLVLGVIRFKKLTMPFQLLVVWLLINFLLDTDVLDNWVISIYKNNAPLSHVESIIEYPFYVMVYYYLFKSKRLKKYILISIPLIVVFGIANALFFQPFTKIFPTYLIQATEILYVLFAILLYKQMLQYTLPVSILKQSVFWFNTAMLLFSTTMFLNFSMMNYYMVYHPKFFPIILVFWYSIDIIFSLLVGIAILTDKRESYINPRPPAGLEFPVS
jgi:hypothetical protein